MKTYLNRIILGLLLSLQACIDPDKGVVNTGLQVLVVEGVLSDQAEQQLIKLSRSYDNGSNVINIPIEKAQLTVTVNGNQLLPLTEIAKGTYVLPNEFRG